MSWEFATDWDHMDSPATVRRYANLFDKQKVKTGIKTLQRIDMSKVAGYPEIVRRADGSFTLEGRVFRTLKKAKEFADMVRQSEVLTPQQRADNAARGRFVGQQLVAGAKDYIQKHPKSTITAGLVGTAGLLYKIFEGTGTAIAIGEAAQKVYNTFSSIYNSQYGPEGEGSGMRGNTEIPTILNSNSSTEEKVAAALSITAKVTNNIWEDSNVPEMLFKMSQDIKIGGFAAIPKSLFDILYGKLLRKIDALKGNTELQVNPDDPDYMRFQRDNYLEGAYTSSSKRAKQVQQGPNYRAEQRGERDRMTTQEIVDKDINARKYVNERGSRGAVQTIPYTYGNPKRKKRT